MNEGLRAKVSQAVAHCWRSSDQGATDHDEPTQREEEGSHTAAAERPHWFNGFVRLIRSVVGDAGLPEKATYEKDVCLPGHFRPSARWDLVITAEGRLIAAVGFELESGPLLGADFGKRTDQAIASAMDTWAVCRTGVYKDSLRPWLGYLILVEDTARSQSPVSVREPHFRVFPEFQNASYVKRYELFCQRLVREGLYNAACLLTSPADGGARGEFAEPCAEIGVAPFVASLAGHVTAYSKLREQRQ